MDENIKTEITSMTPRTDIDKRFMETDDIDEQKHIEGIYNSFIEKADLLRRMKSSDVLDRVMDQLSERVDKKAGEFTNKELLDTVQLLNTVVEKGISVKEDTPKIQINQKNQININEPHIDRESRDRVAEAIKAIMKKAATSNPMEDKVVEIKEEDIKTVDSDKSISE